MLHKKQPAAILALLVFVYTVSGAALAAGVVYPFDGNVFPEDMNSGDTLVLAAGNYVTLDLSDFSELEDITITSDGPAIIHELVATGPFGELSGWAFDGSNGMTIERWNVPFGITCNGVKFFKVNFIANNDTNSVVLDLFNEDPTQLTANIGADGLTFEGCRFECENGLKIVCENANSPNRVSIINCNFIGTDASGGNELLYAGKHADITVSGGAMVNGYASAGGSADMLSGSLSVSSVAMKESAILVRSIENVLIKGNTFESGTNKAYPYAIGFEMRNGNDIGATLIDGNTFWHDGDEAGVAISCIAPGGDDAFGIQSVGCSSNQIDISNNDFCGVSRVFGDFNALDADKPDTGRLVFGGGNILPAGSSADDMFNSVENRGAYQIGHTLSVKPPKPVLGSSGSSGTASLNMMPYPASVNDNLPPASPSSDPNPAEVPYAGANGIGSGEARANLSAFEKSSLKGKAAFKLAEGDGFAVLALYGKYALIEKEGVKGYVALSKINTAFTSNPVAATSRKCNVYAEPSAKKGLQAGRLPKGIELEVTEVAGAWARITYTIDGETLEAWIQIKDIKIVIRN